MQHDVEPETEGDQEEGVPDEEGSESFQYFVEHRDIDVVLGQFRMSSYQSDQSGPTDDDSEGCQCSLGFTRSGELLVRNVEDDSSQHDGDQLQPVLHPEDISRIMSSNIFHHVTRRHIKSKCRKV